MSRKYLNLVAHKPKTGAETVVCVLCRKCPLVGASSLMPILSHATYSWSDCFSCCTLCISRPTWSVQFPVLNQLTHTHRV